MTTAFGKNSNIDSNIDSNKGNRKIRKWTKGVTLNFGLLGFLMAGCMQQSGPSHLKLNLKSEGIVNGEAVKSEELIARSTVDLYLDLRGQGSNRGFQNVCTATLISPKVVLSAAHCFVEVAKGLGITIEEVRQIAYIGFGVGIIKDLNEAIAKGVELRKIAQVEVNEDYLHSNPKPGSNKDAILDMSMLKLESPAPKGFGVAHLLKDATKIAKGTALTLSGFGLTNASDQTRAEHLMKIPVTIDNPSFNPTQFTYKVIDGKSGCSGDSGGPAYLNELDTDGSLILAGVTSWGDRSCSQLGAYTSVPAMLTWIQSKLDLMNSDL